jgi:hypothetical protein
VHTGFLDVLHHPAENSSCPSYRASTSISTASSRNRSTSTGCSKETAVDLVMYEARRRRRNDLHAAPAQHVAGPDEHRVADLRGALLRVVVRRRRAVLGRGSPASASTSPNAPRSSARWIASGRARRSARPRRQPCASPSGVCPPELHDHARRPGRPAARRAPPRARPRGSAARSTAGRRCRSRSTPSRVAVDHHRLVAAVATAPARVHAGVVELDALADPVRARCPRMSTAGVSAGATSVSSS